MHLLMKNSTNLQDEIKLIPKNKQKDFLVYYDEFNGNISSITTQKPEVFTSPYIIDLSGIAEKIIKGDWKKGTIPKYWDGKTSKRIIDKILSFNNN